VFAITASNTVNCIGYPDEFQSEISALVGQRLPKPCDRERLARAAAAKQIGGFDFAGVNPVGDEGHIAKVRDGRVVVGQHCRWKRFNLGQPRSLPSKRSKCDRRGLDARTDAAEPHADSPCFLR
jgi:hypothetical protein